MKRCLSMKVASSLITHWITSKNLPIAHLNLNPLTVQLRNCLQMCIKLFSALDNTQREKLFYSIQYKNLLKPNYGCF